MAPRWKSGAEAAAGKAQADAPPSGGRSFGLGIGGRRFGVGRHGVGGMLTAAAKADEHLHDARELVLRAGGVGGTEAASHAEDVEGGSALHR